MLPATKASHIFPAAGGGGSLFVCSRSPGPQQAPPTSQILAQSSGSNAARLFAVPCRFTQKAHFQCFGSSHAHALF